MDPTLFLENIVPTLQLTKRCWSEPLFTVTSVYNDALELLLNDLRLVIIDRLSARDEVVSATVRAAIRDVNELKLLVPATTYHYLEEKHFVVKSKEKVETIMEIKKSALVGTLESK